MPLRSSANGTWDIFSRSICRRGVASIFNTGITTGRWIISRTNATAVMTGIAMTKPVTTKATARICWRAKPFNSSRAASGTVGNHSFCTFLLMPYTRRIRCRKNTKRPTRICQNRAARMPECSPRWMKALGKFWRRSMKKGYAKIR